MKSKSFLAKAFLMLLAVLFSLTGARAQETLTVYEGTATSNYVPAYIFYFDDFTRSQFVIPAGDLEAMAGGGTISALKFYTISDNVPYTTASEVDVYLMEVDYTTMTALEPKNNGTIVYHGTLDVVAEGDGGSLTIEFDTPYTYGGGNLLVGIENTTDAGYKNIKFLGTEAEGAAWAGSNGTSLDDVTGSVRNFIPMTTFTYTPGGGVVYPKPTDLTVSDLTTNSVTISWTEPEGKVDGYAYQYKKTTDEEWSTEATVADPTVTLTSLEAGTAYNFRVKAIYGEDASSYASINFTTDCDVVTLPFEEDFSGAITCWTLTDCHSQTGLSGGTFAFHYSTTPPQYLISPEFNATTAIMVSFYYAIYSANYPETFQVGYSSTTNDVDAFTWGDEVTATNTSEWLKYEAECPAGTKFVAIRYNSNDKYYLYVTSFSIVESNGLFTPTDLAVSEVGSKSAKLSWTENGTATAWQVRLYSGEEEVSIINADSNPFTLEGLTPETNYIVRVRAIDGENTGEWSNAVSFTTDVAFPAPTELAAEPTATTATITWTGNDEATSYVLEYAEGGSVLYKYDNGTCASDLGISAEFSCAAMFPAGSFTGSTLSYVRLYDASAAEAIVTIYSGGDAEPEGTALASENVTLTGADTPVDVNFDVTIDPTKNVWVVVTLPSGGYYAVATDELGDANGRWSNLGSGWVDLASVGGTGYCWMIGAEIGTPGDITWTTIEGATSPAEITGLDPETTYYVRVKAIYADGESTWATTSFTTLEDVPTPSDLAVSEVGNKSAKLSWTENGEATAWQIALNGDEENLIAADSNPFTLEGLTPETAYTAKVRAVNGEKTSKWSNEVSFTTDIQFPAPTELATEPATTTATITWTGTADSYNLRYRVSTGGDELVTDFEDSSMGEWTTIDADGDGYDWVLGSATNGIYLNGNLAGSGNNASQDLVVSGSYSNLSGALTPDNYLVSPKVKLGGSISFYACAQDGSYAAEHFGVAVSTAGNTDAADFTTIEEWTMTNAGTPASSRRKAQGTWGFFTVDLSAYEGQEGYVAIRHFNCTDQFLLNVDDITIVEPAEGEEQPWTTIANATSPYTIEGLDPETKYDVQVQAVYADGESTWAATHFTTLSENSAPSNIAADLVADGATLTWEGQGDSYNVRYRVAGDDGEIFADDFENGLGNWTIYTEGEAISGYDGWVMMSNGTYVAVSFSWYGGTAYAADNWLITPAVELTGTLTFDVMVDANYPDSYEVLLSTTGDAIEDFTTELQAMAGGTTGTVTIDLSAYAGQTGYIAIHHVSTDYNYLCIDNFGIYGEPTPAGEWQTIATNDLTATISGLETNSLYEYQIQSVKGESESEWSEIDEFALVTLDCAGENSGLIKKFDGKYAHVTLANRTLYKDGTWNTIFLPFNLTADEFTASPLADGDLRTLDSVEADETTVTLNFMDAFGMAEGYPEIIGGYPYIIKWAAGDDVINPEFANVTITTDEYYNPASTEAESISVYFEGTYDNITCEEDYTSILFIGADNKLNYPLAGATIGATRGYFYLDGVTAGEGSGVKFFTNLDGDGATGIANINAEESGDWYDISGRKLAGKPSMKGIYVNGGRKVTVK